MHNNKMNTYSMISTEHLLSSLQRLHQQLLRLGIVLTRLIQRGQVVECYDRLSMRRTQDTSTGVQAADHQRLETLVVVLRVVHLQTAGRYSNFTISSGEINSWLTNIITHHHHIHVPTNAHEHPMHC